MKAEAILRKAGAGLSAATLAIALTACAHHPAMAGDDYGHVRTEANATSSSTSSDQVVGTAPAPSNSPNTGDKSTPAIISGPAKVDNSGNAYTSSSAGGAGNGASTGLNTNVNIIPSKSKSDVTVTQSPSSTMPEPAPMPAPMPMAEPAPAPMPAPMPMAEPAPAPEPEPVTTTTTTTTKTRRHRRMHKD